MRAALLWARRILLPIGFVVNVVLAIVSHPAFWGPAIGFGWASLWAWFMPQDRWQVLRDHGRDDLR